MRCPGYDPPPCRSSPVRPVEGLQQIFVSSSVGTQGLLRPSRPARKRLCTVLAGTEAAFESPADGERRQRSQRSPECALLPGNFFRALVFSVRQNFAPQAGGAKMHRLLLGPWRPWRKSFVWGSDLRFVFTDPLAAWLITIAASESWRVASRSLRPRQTRKKSAPTAAREPMTPSRELHGLLPRQVLRRGLPKDPPQAAQKGMQEARGRAQGREAVQSGAR